MANAAEKSNRLVERQNCINVIGLILLALTALFAGGAWRAGRDAVKVTEKVGVAQIRAYLTIDKPQLYFKTDGRFCVYMPVKYLGQTPAFNVVLKLSLIHI